MNRRTIFKSRQNFFQIVDEMDEGRQGEAFGRESVRILDQMRMRHDHAD
jgi:hypothetical protein